jgi:hypothetical protein
LLTQILLSFQQVLPNVHGETLILPANNL